MTHPPRLLRRLAGSTAALALVCAAACGRQSGPSTPHDAAHPIIGATLLNLSAEYIAELDQAMTAEAHKLGVQLVVNDAQLSANRQIAQVEGFIAQKVDAIILNPCQVDGSSPAVDEAKQASIPIVNVNSETRATPTAFVGSRDEDAGEMAMTFIAQRLHGHGNIVIIEGPMGQAAQLKRFAGAQAVLKRFPGIKVLATQPADWDRAKAMGLMENWLESFHGQVDAVLAENDEMAMGALLALEQAGLKKNVVVIGVDGIADALAAVKAGRLDATVFQDADGQGRAAVDVAVALARHQPCAPQTLIPFQLVTSENVARFLQH